MSAPAALKPAAKPPRPDLDAELNNLAMSKESQPLFDAVRTGGRSTVATDCPLAALQIAQGTGAEPKHPIQVLAEAYGIEHEADHR